MTEEAEYKKAASLPDKELLLQQHVNTASLIWRCQFLMWRMSSQMTIRRCKKFVNLKQEDRLVALRRLATPKGKREKRQFTGLCLCGSPQCPRCAQIIAMKRAVKLEKGLNYWLNSTNENGQNRGILFITLTMSHSRKDSLEKLLAAFRKARTALTNGSSYRGRSGDRLRYQIAGMLGVVEVTYSYQFGYHPHLHLLVMLDQPLTAEIAVNLTARFHKRWERALSKDGFQSIQRHTDVKPIRNFDEGSKEYIAQYLNKTAPWRIIENINSPHDYNSIKKRNWTFFELLALLSIEDDALKHWFPLHNGETVHWDSSNHMEITNDRTGEITYDATVNGTASIWRIIHEMESGLKGFQPYRLSKRRPIEDTPLDRAWNAFLNAGNGLDADEKHLIQDTQSNGDIIRYFTQSEWLTEYVNHPEQIIKTLKLDA